MEGDGDPGPVRGLLVGRVRAGERGARAALGHRVMTIYRKVYDGATGVYIGCIWQDSWMTWVMAEDRDVTEMGCASEPVAEAWLRARWARHELNDRRVAA